MYSYGLMIAIGVIMAVVVAEKRAPRYNLNGDHIFNIAIWGVVGGVVGAKVLYWIVELPSIIQDPSIILNIGEGFVIYGGILGGILGGFFYCRYKKISFLKYFDLAMPSVALAQGFGRIGCLMAGCCYGRETDSWFHIVFTQSHIAPNGVPLIPTQIISSAADFLHFFVLVWLAKGQRETDRWLLLSDFLQHRPFFDRAFAGRPQRSGGRTFHLPVYFPVYSACRNNYRRGLRTQRKKGSCPITLRYILHNESRLLRRSRFFYNVDSRLCLRRRRCGRSLRRKQDGPGRMEINL